MSKVPWEESQIFFNGDDFFNQLLKKVDEATNRIWFEVYIFEWDRLGQRIADHLKRAQKRGVQVQVLVDGIGSYGSEDA
jgi:cardiolipin synthase